MRSLDQLLDAPAESRDPNWENEFFHQITTSNVNILSPEPQTGPDSWPYLMVESDSEAKESVQKILHWLSDKGIGLVLNPTEEYPDYIFTFGMIWHFKETGLFIRPQSEVAKGAIEISGQDIFAGSPSPYNRSIQNTPK